MSKTNINVSAVLSANDLLASAKNKVSDVLNSYSSTAGRVDNQVKNRSNIAGRMNSIQCQLTELRDGMDRIRKTVDSSANRYYYTDRDVNARKNELNTLVAKSKIAPNSIFAALFATNVKKVKRISSAGDDDESNTIKSGAAAAATGADDATDKERSAFAKFANNELKASGAVLSGETSGEGEFLGFSTAGSASGSLLYGEAGIKTKMSWKAKNKDGNWDFKSFGLSTEAKATGALAKGEVEGNVGYLHGKLEGSALTGTVSGEVKATLWDDGKFNPSLFLGGKAEGSVLKGSAEGGFGTDQYGIYAKADGDLLHAEAEANAGVGYIGKDKNGKEQYGASAKASAMASLAQGKVKGGITLFGIDIDVGLKGYAGAAGVEVGGSVSTSGVKANLSGALALGAGLDVSVDWSDATWVGDTIDAVGDFVGEASDFVSNVSQTMWTGITSTADSVGDFLFGWL